MLITDTSKAASQNVVKDGDTKQDGKVAVLAAESKPYFKNMKELVSGPVESLSVEYYVWNSKYFMMIKYVSSDYSVHFKILTFKPEEADKVGEVLFEKEIYSREASKEGDSMGSAIAHNNLFTTYGQWVFFYTISSDQGKKEDTL